MVDEELKEHCDNNQVLWMVWGETNSLYFDTIHLIHSPPWGYIAWGYSVYRRSPGFRTLGLSIKHFRTKHKIVQLFTDQTDAIDYFMANSGTSKSFEEIRAEHTPSLRFLKKENYRHNLSVVI